MEIRIRVLLSGAPNAATLTVNIPSGYTIDTSKLPAADVAVVLGSAKVHDATGAVYHVDPRYNTTTSVMLINMGATTTYVNQPSVVNNTTPMTFASGDSVGIFLSVPIVEWA